VLLSLSFSRPHDKVCSFAAAHDIAGRQLRSKSAFDLKKKIVMKIIPQLACLDIRVHAGKG
jgi:hypothetical protein